MKETVKVALISENGDNDTEALRFLLNQYTFKNDFQKTAQFIPLLKRLKGDKWEVNKRVIGMIEEACFDKEPKLLVFVRDLDAFLSVKEQIEKLKDWFNALKVGAPCKTLLYLAVQKIEALILADLKNAYGKKYVGDHMFKENPDTFIKQYGYEKNKLVDIFKKMKIENVRQNHKNHELSFDTFIENLEKEIKRLK